MGRGNNFYIKSDDGCNNAFALELGGLLSLYGQNIQISVTPSGNMLFKEMLSEYKCEQVNGFRLLTPGKIVKSGQIWAGNPAKYFRDLTEAERNYIKISAENYMDLAREYKEIEL